MATFAAEWKYFSGAFKIIKNYLIHYRSEYIIKVVGLRRFGYKESFILY